MLHQIHHQWPDHTEMVAQKDLSGDFSETREWVKEIKASHPLPQGAQWMMCNEKSEFFVWARKEGK